MASIMDPQRQSAGAQKVGKEDSEDRPLFSEKEENEAVDSVVRALEEALEEMTAERDNLLAENESLGQSSAEVSRLRDLVETLRNELVISQDKRLLQGSEILRLQGEVMRAQAVTTRYQAEGIQLREAYNDARKLARAEAQSAIDAAGAELEAEQARRAEVERGFRKAHELIRDSHSGYGAWLSEQGERQP